MKIIINIFVLLLLLISFVHSAEAQIVQKNRAGEVFIDCSQREWATSTSQNLIGDVRNSDSYLRTKVYKRLQIATFDCKADGTKRDQSYALMSWYTAVGLDAKYATASADGQQQGQVKTGCAAYYEQNEGEKGSWRVPTIRELVLMWVLSGKDASTGDFKGPLAKALGISMLKDEKYWSSSEVIISDTYLLSVYLDFVDGFAENPNRNGPQYSLRCVREVKTEILKY